MKRVSRYAQKVKSEGETGPGDAKPPRMDWSDARPPKYDDMVAPAGGSCFAGLSPGATNASGRPAAFSGRS